jgi:hypothetical protein
MLSEQILFSMAKQTIPPSRIMKYRRGYFLTVVRLNDYRANGISAKIMSWELSQSF